MRIRLVPAALALCALGAAAQEPDAEKDSIEEIKRMLNVTVTSASLHAQSLQDAPANATVITADEIARYGFRTLGEVLSNTGSFYMTSDGTAQYAGVRGFSLPGDFNTRFIVMVDGHPLTDNVYGAMFFFGQDFPLDLDNVSQIEIVRGPTSALYGSNGLFATVNVVTKGAGGSGRARISGEGGSFGDAKLAFSVSGALKNGARWQISASGLKKNGRTVDFEQWMDGGPSRVEHVEQELGYHALGRVEWKNWTLTALFSQHKAIAPHGWYGTVIGDTGTRDLEGRNFVEFAWRRDIGREAQLRWTAFYDQYRYDGVFDNGGDAPNREFDGAIGDWLGTRFLYQRDGVGRGTLVLGAEGKLDLRNVLYNFAYPQGSREPEQHFRINDNGRFLGIFAQQELKISPAWSLVAGGRLDAGTSGLFFSPRLAGIYTGHRSTYKLLYGRAFRNPTTYERFWEPSQSLEAERIRTLEFAREQMLPRSLNLVTSLFRYDLDGLIEGIPVRRSVLQFRNGGATAMGVEAELGGSPFDWLDVTAGGSVQRTRGTSSHRELPNSPARLARFRASVPLHGPRYTAAIALRYVDARAGRLESPGYAATDLTFRAARLAGVDLQFGVRNVFGARYSDPLSPEHTPLQLPAPGRTFFAKVTRNDE